MYKGIYLALSGAVLKQRHMEVITQNLANANTLAYKRDGLSFKDYLVASESASPGPDQKVMTDLSAFSTDHSSGNLVQTGNPLDTALEGDGFFSLEGSRFTRRGDFKVDKEGYLTTHKGLKVLGRKGPIKVPKGKLEIGPDGGLSVDGEAFDTIRIVDFSNKDTLMKAGEGIFTTKATGTPSKALVRQGYIETSNVDIVHEMVRMIETLREFEAYQKAIHAFDEAAGKANNEIGRL
jgi:flagellar basal-body rod protein FlgG